MRSSWLWGWTRSTPVSTGSPSSCGRKRLPDSPAAAHLPAWLLGGALLLACGAPALPAASPVAIPTLAPAAPSPTTPPATPTSPPVDSGWQPVSPGLEKRTLPVYGPDAADPFETVTALRLDPAVFTFDVGYRPGDPRPLRDWLAEGQADVVINGGYFTPEWVATGLIVRNGEALGVSYRGFGGMVAVRDGALSLRPLGTQPYDPAEPLDAGLQSFPLLVQPGGTAAIGAELADDRPDRRAAIGQDAAGQVLLFLAPRGGLTLHAFSQFLAGGDFGLEIALNLDGGTSGGLLWVEGEQINGVPSFSPVPAVLLARVP